MKHFKTEQWVDFVNRTNTQEQATAMQKHLAGCRQCTEEVALWQKVRNFATAEPAYQPPKQEVRTAAAIFSTAGRASRLKEKGTVIELLFDSLLQPAFAGARTASTGIRQVLYRADSFQIDLQIEAKPGANRIAVTGQVLDVSRPEIIGSGLEVTLSNRRGNVVHASTNEFGEFHVEIQNSGDLELSLRCESGEPIVISLKDTLTDLPGGEQ